MFTYDAIADVQAWSSAHNRGDMSRDDVHNAYANILTDLENFAYDAMINGDDNAREYFNMQANTYRSVFNSFSF